MICDFVHDFLNKHWVELKHDIDKQNYLELIKQDTKLAIEEFSTLVSNSGPLKNLWVYTGPPDDFSQVFYINNKYIMITKSIMGTNYIVRFCEKKTKVITYFE